MCRNARAERAVAAVKKPAARKVPVKK